MTFLSLLAALLLEQVRPPRAHGDIHRWFRHFAAGVEDRLDGGLYQHGMVSWAVVLVPLLVVAAGLYHLLLDLGVVAAWLWNVVVLHLTVRFSQFSHPVNEIQAALRAGDVPAARDRLERWCGERAHDLTANEIARVAIEHGLLAAHRQAFAAIAWFAALGPAGAVLYRGSALLAEQWGTHGQAGSFGLFAARVFYWLDWVPARLTAVTLAIVGNFEDAIYCWREQAAGWTSHAREIILASAGGALGVVLGGPIQQSGGLQLRPEAGLGEEADADALESALRLIWRSLAVWMFLILLATLAYWLG
ncbi:MAG TPA: CobD/CbiB family protein [Burkholderiales bacterium]|nr:CobD/CbiB family protein [Burkholderiales bacterium]